MKKKPKTHKRKPIKILLFIACIGAIGLFRDTLLLFGVDLVLSQAAPLSYKTIEWSEGQIVLSHVTMEEERWRGSCDSVALELSLEGLHLRSHLFFSHPEIAIKGEHEEDSSLPPSLALLLPSKWHTVKMDMQHGVLQLNKRRLFFAFASGQEKEEIGTLSLFQDPGLANTPDVQIMIRGENGHLNGSFIAENLSCERLIDIAGVFDARLSEGWVEVRGEVQASGEIDILVATNSIQQLNCELNVGHLALSNALLGFHLEAERYQGSLSYPPDAPLEEELPFWKRLSATSLLEKGEILSGDLGLSNLNAKLFLDPHRDPIVELSAALIHQGERFPLAIQGKGSVHEDHSFWLELHAALGDRCRAFFSLCSPEVDNYILAADVAHLSCEQEGILRLLMPFLNMQHLVQLDAGEVKGKITAWIASKELYRLQIEEFAAENLRFHSPDGSVQGSIAKCTGEGRLAHDGNKAWKFHHLDLAVQSAAFAGKDWHSEQLDSHFSVEEMKLHPSWIRGSHLGVPFEIHLQGPSLDTHLTVHAKTDLAILENILTGKATQKASGQELLTEVTLRKNEQGVAAHGALIVNQEKVEFGCDLFPHKNGWVRSEHVPAPLVNSLCNVFLPHFTVEGKFDLFGTFDAEKVELSLQAEELFVDHPSVAIYVPCMGKKDPQLLDVKERMKIQINLAEKTYAIQAPFVADIVEEKNTGLQLRQLKSVLEIQENHLRLDKWSALCEGLQIEGDLAIDFGNHFELTASTTKILGDLGGALRIIEKAIPSWKCDLPIQGEVISGKDGVALWCRQTEQGLDTAWRLQAAVREFTLPLNPSAKLQNGQCDITYDSHSAEFYVRNCFAELVAKGGRSLALSLDLERIGHIAFEGEVKEGARELIKISGRADARKNGQFECTLDSTKSHFFGGHLELSSWIDSEARIETLECSSDFLSADLLSMGLLLQDFHLVETALLQSLPISGHLHADVGYKRASSETWFSMNSPELQIAEESFGSFSLSARKNQEHWQVEYLHLGDLALKGEMDVRPTQFDVTAFDLKWGQQSMRGKGVYDRNSGEMQGNLERLAFDFSPFDIPLHAQNGEAIRFHYSPIKGFSVQNLDLFLQDPRQEEATTECLVGAVTIEPNGAKCYWKDLQVRLSPQMVASLVASDTIPSFAQSFKKDGSLTIFSEGEFTLKTRQLLTSVKSEYRGHPLYVTLQTDFSDQLLGSMKIRDHLQSEGVKILFREKQMERIQGSFSGLEIQMERSGDGLEGSIAVDFKQLSPWLSEELQAGIKKLELGKGYTLQGRLESAPFAFTGELLGEECELLGYLLHSLHAKVALTPAELLLENLALEDEAGAAFAKLIRLGGNRLDIPLVQVHDLRSSHLRKKEGGERIEKPFMIKNLTFTDVQGSLDDLTTLTGHGECQFTNSYKKESTLIDLPLDFLKNLGLDLGLFTPIYGEIECEIEGGKCWLRNMHNTYSEGKRSQFYLYLAEGGSYLDFAGNIRIDLKMKQNVVLKVAEPFTLQVRGTLEKPRYALSR